MRRRGGLPSVQLDRDDWELAETIIERRRQLWFPRTAWTPEQKRQNVVGYLSEVAPARWFGVATKPSIERDPGWDIVVGVTRVEVRHNNTHYGDFYVNRTGRGPNRRFIADAGMVVYPRDDLVFELGGWVSWCRFELERERHDFYGPVWRMTFDQLDPIETLKEWRCVPSPRLSTLATAPV